MGRGVGHFEGGLLRAARKQTPDPADPTVTLTAARLAELIGTSKAQILAYENGRSRPSPGRLAELAEKLKVPTTVLCSRAAAEAELAGFREARGLTVEALAERLNLSVNTYKRIEREGMFPKSFPEVVWDLAEELRIDQMLLQRKISSIPAVQGRRKHIAAMLDPLVDGALQPGPLPELLLGSWEALLLASRYSVSPQSVVQLVDVELRGLRSLAARRAVAETQMAYAFQERLLGFYEHNLYQLQGEISETRSRLPEIIDRYLGNPLPPACWGLLGDLYQAGPGGLDLESVDRSALSVLGRYFDGHLIEATLIGVNLSPPGALFAQDVAPYYAALYGTRLIYRDSRQWELRGVLPSGPRRSAQALRQAHVLGLDPRPFFAKQYNPQSRVGRVIRPGSTAPPYDTGRDVVGS